ncbi:beta-ketoacyl synthase N-terminal-like domain-containing protein [Nocardia sp. NPDC059240]|uniref:beta-ketoacyl synthase N-terminal-like domain-containing protein n=1 Tax=Nocardia sp. NPDC059240 TaxID=3346786 RepID=UPI00367A58C9
MSDTYSGTPIAIVGIGCLLPGANTPQQFWDNLLAGADLRRAGGAETFGTDPATPGGWGDETHEITAVRGGFVTEPAMDHEGLRIDAQTVEGLGAVVRWPLYAIRQALADAGITEDDPVLDRTGLVLGNYSFPTEQSVALCLPFFRDGVSRGLRQAGLPLPDKGSSPWQPAEPVRSLWPSGLPTTVVADALGLHGPRLALDAACSSALYSMSLARDYLATGAADVVLAGAVCAPDPLLIHLSFSDLHAYPGNGISQPFDAASSGIVTGQGAGVVVLKRLADAVRDGDRIHAVVESIGLGNDGAGAHPLVPNISGQLAAYRQAYTGGVDPHTVDYIECHATGTPVGDPIELRGLTEFFGADRVPLLGSVKGNVGHLLTVAGFTSVLKAILAMRHGTIPATPTATEPIRPAGAETAADRLVTANQPWPGDPERPRRAGVSAFGFGGTNAHLVLTDTVPSPPESAVPQSESTVSEAKSEVPQPVRMAIEGLGVRIGEVAGVAALRRVRRGGRPTLAERPETRWYGAESLGITELETDAAGGYVNTVEVDIRGYRMPPAELAQANPQHLLLFEAAEEALADAGLTVPAKDRTERRIGVVVAMEMEPRSVAHRARFDIGAHVRAECTRTGLDLTTAELDRLEAAVRAGVHDPIGANEVLSYIGNVMAARIAAAHNFTGPAFTVSADATGGARALEVAGLLLLDPTVEAVLVGGVELAAGYENTLTRTTLANGTRPPLGDGAAALVLTRAVAGPTPTTTDPAHSTPDPARRGDDLANSTAEPARSTAAAARSTAEPALDSADPVPGNSGSGAGSGASALTIDAVVIGAGGSESFTRRVDSALVGRGLTAADVGYVELVGGVTDGDLAVLAGIYGDRGPDAPACALAGVVPLVGDTQQAGVLVGLVSAALSLRHRELPPAASDLHELAETAAEFGDSALRLLDGPVPWLGRRAADRLVAAVHAVDGPAAAHIVVSAPPARPTIDTVDWSGSTAPLLIPLSGDSASDLAAAALACLAALDDGATPLELARQRVAAERVGRYVAAIVAADADGLRRELASAIKHLPETIAEGRDWTTPSGSYCTSRPVGAEGRVAFVYPGAFTSYPGAGRDLFTVFPGLLTEFERDARTPWAEYKHSALFPSGSLGVDRAALMRHEGELIESIPTMLAIGTNSAVLTTRMLRDALGIRQDGGFGYSLGESSMLFAVDAWDAAVRDDAPLTRSPLFIDQLRGPKRLVRSVWQLPESTPDRDVWTTQVLLAGAEEVRAAMPGLDRVYLTHVNTPREVVVAGFPEQVRELIARLGCKAAKAPANHVMHCAVVESERAQFAALNDHPLGAPAANLELLSSFDYGTVDVSDRSVISDRIAETLCTTVDFAKLTETAYERGFRVFIEVGPGATCTRWIGETLGAREHVAVAVDRRGMSTGQAVCAALARLVSHGVDVRLDRLFPPAPEQSRPAFRATVTCGGESLVERVRERAHPILAEANARRAAQEAEAHVLLPITIDPDAIVIEGDPFVYLPQRRPTDLPTAADYYRPATHASDAHPAAAYGPSSHASHAHSEAAHGRGSHGPASHSAAAYGPGSDAAATQVAAAFTGAAPAAAAHLPSSQNAPTGDAVATSQSAPHVIAARTRVLQPMRRTVFDAHESFLRVQGALAHASLEALEAGRGLPPTPPSAATGPSAATTPAEGIAPADSSAPATGSATGSQTAPVSSVDLVSQSRTVVWDEAQLLEFASGKVANVFGPDFAEYDTYPVRVRLPEPPYHFVTRVTEINGTPGVYEPASITTEYDVPVGAWYSVDGLVPCAVTIEAGQCDLLLISYLGIDFRNKGERVYRLLDSELVFHGGLPREGQTLRYEINIARFVWNGDSLLFFFNYRCYADGVLILELLNACAGFFAAAELENSLGVVTSGADRKRREAMTRTWFKPLARTERTALSGTDLDLLAQGRPAEVFGPAWDQTADGSNRSLRLPDSMLRMIDEITEIDRLGGPCGIGEISAVKHLDPEGWYFKCHFPGDPVLAGSLVAEGGVQLLQVYAMYLGMHLVLPDAEFQAVPGLKTQVKVRGQITPRHESIRYHVEITKLTMLPRPTVIADIVVYDGDKPMISMQNFGVQVKEKPGTHYRPETGGIPAFLGRRNAQGEPAFINELHLAHAAKGDLATAMGPEFEIYADRKAPYIPNGDFRFVDRIMRFSGVRGVLKSGSTMETEYDCPPEAWYFHENSFPGMPNAVYMESSLQAAILLGYYQGATLATPDQELNIRNLDGTATVVKQVDLRGKTIRQHSRMTFNQVMPGTSLQKFQYELFADGELIYKGESMFGYHTADALANQVGLDGGKYVAPWLDTQDSLPATAIRTLAVRSADDWFTREGLRLADGHLRMVDTVDLVAGGGKYEQGYLRGHREIDHDDWYFECHFYRDPVMPGSLGVEALIQALQVYAIEADLGAEFADPVFAMPVGVPMTWKYRGQILRTEGPMTFDLHIKEIRREGDRALVIADANVWKPGMRIYEITDIAVEVHNRREDER